MGLEPRNPFVTTRAIEGPVPILCLAKEPQRGVVHTGLNMALRLKRGTIGSASGPHPKAQNPPIPGPDNAGPAKTANPVLIWFAQDSRFRQCAGQGIIIIITLIIMSIALANKWSRPPHIIYALGMGDASIFVLNSK